MRLYTRCGFRRNDLQTFIILWMTLFINKKLGCYRKNRAYSLDNCIHKKVVLSQRWPRNAPINGCPENFRDSLTTLAATLPKSFHRLLFWLTLWMCVQNLKSVALPVPEIIGGTQKCTWLLGTSSSDSHRGSASGANLGNCRPQAFDAHLTSKPWLCSVLELFKNSHGGRAP